MPCFYVYHGFPDPQQLPLGRMPIPMISATCLEKNRPVIDVKQHRILLNRRIWVFSQIPKWAMTLNQKVYCPDWPAIDLIYKNCRQPEKVLDRAEESR
jgi:hypothetical protein